MKKKLLFLSLTVISSISFVSCGSSLTNSSTNQNPTSTKADTRLTKKENKLYVDTDAGIETDSTAVYYIKGEEEIPFVNLFDSLNIMQRCHNDTNIKIEGEVITIGRDNLDSTVTFNFQKKTVYYSDLDEFATKKYRKSVLNLISDYGTLDNGASKYLNSESSAGLDFYVRGNPITIDLNKNNIPMYFIDGGGYIPVQTMSDLLFSFNNIYLLFNGNNYFISGESLPDDLKKMYYEGNTGTRSEKFARYGRDELALELNLIYGLKKEHDIDDFDSYFNASGLDEGLLSTDPLKEDSAIAKLIYSNFSDYHSSFIFPTYLAGQDKRDEILAGKGIYAPNFSEYQLIRQAFSYARKLFITH